MIYLQLFGLRRGKLTYAQILDDQKHEQHRSFRPQQLGQQYMLLHLVTTEQYCQQLVHQDY